MCRIFAYISVNPMLLDDALNEPPNAISKQTVYWIGLDDGGQEHFDPDPGSPKTAATAVDDTGTQMVNADGFGFSWYTDARSQFNPYGERRLSDKPSSSKPVGRLFGIYNGPLSPFVSGPQPAIYKTTIAKPTNDPCFASICANVSSKCILAHVRAAWSPPVATTNNHPFVFGRHCFMMNGRINGSTVDGKESDFADIRKDMLGCISQKFTAMIEGGTDTEHIAAIYMTYLCGDSGDPESSPYTAASMWSALRSAIQVVENIQKMAGITSDNYLNICATNGESLIALCYRTNEADTPYGLWVSLDVADTLNRKAYGDIFRDTRSEKEIKKVAQDLLENPRHVVQRDQNGKVTGIAPELQRILKKAQSPSISMHGQHIVIASEPTTIDQSWYKLFNKEVILVDVVREGATQVLNITVEGPRIPIPRRKHLI